MGDLSNRARLPSLKDIVNSWQLKAKKSLGQNFLLDANITGKIVSEAERVCPAIDIENHTIIEVGPGPGGLTRALLDKGARHLTVIEKDPRCLPALDQLADYYEGQLTVIGGDALKTDFSAIGTAPRHIFANLPYNIGTKLLTGWLETGNNLSTMTLMFQKEVAERIVASPGSKTYGRLSVLAGWLADTRILFDLPPSVFVPPPKVTSSVVQLVVKPDVGRTEQRANAMSAVTAAAFGQRRKMLRKSLKTLGVGDVIALCEQAGIDPTTRAEQVDVPGFLRLAEGFLQNLKE